MCVSECSEHPTAEPIFFSDLVRISLGNALSSLPLIGNLLGPAIKDGSKNTPVEIGGNSF